MKKLIVIFAVLLLIGFSGGEVEAAEKEAEQKLHIYLSAVEHQNLTNIIDNVIDLRYTTKEEQMLSYARDLMKNRLVEYKILESSPIDEDTYTFITQLSFENGAMEQVPFHLSLVNNDWNVIIGFVSLSTNDYKVLKEGLAVEQENIVSPLDSSTLCTWNFSGRGAGEFLSNCRFSINRPSASLNLTVSRQTHAFPSSYPITVTYTIVRNRVFGETEHGSVVVTGHRTRPSNHTIRLNTTTLTDAQIRFKTASTMWGHLDYQWSGSLH
ncbi:hypothetical protein ACERII_19315 [Evansella sp. AB-rgal1]|uniref:hypothetical protein n=1 Tax=Evansella sp. AB-rgal1 TaxID=3242696 RepID=UPI00359EE7A1